MAKKDSKRMVLAALPWLAELGLNLAGYQNPVIGWGLVAAGPVLAIYLWRDDIRRLRLQSPVYRRLAQAPRDTILPYQVPAEPIIRSPERYVRAFFTSANPYDLAERARIAFCLHVFNGLDSDIVFKVAEAGQMVYENTSTALQPLAKVQPAQDGVIHSGEVENVEIVQQFSEELADSILAEFSSGKRQGFDWSHLRVRFRYQEAEYTLKIPDGVWILHGIQTGETVHMRATFTL